MIYRAKAMSVTECYLPAQKTGQTLSLRVEAPLQKIIDRYDSDSPYVLPVLTADDSYRAYRQQQRELTNSSVKSASCWESPSR